MDRDQLFIGIDVGTGSARAGVFDGEGRTLGTASHAIQIWRPRPEFAEQSSDDIWSAVCRAVREAMQKADARAEAVCGIGFDATCSLVALDANDKPVTVSPDGRDEQNVILWMDHRALDQARRINETEHPVLQYVGSRISPEMETPKLLWIKENLPQTWSRTARWFDLPDFLTYRATGVDQRSLCSTVCKWTYLGHEKGSVGSIGRWDESYFRLIGLGDLAGEQFARIGRRVRPMGEPIGKGLSPLAASELGLVAGTPVGVSIIDAHAGGVGMLGAPLDGQTPTPQSMIERLALIGGTSSCHMAVSTEPAFIPGVWGPYWSAMVPGLWLSEGGQSATGALIDHVIFTHACAGELKERAAAAGRTVYELLNEKLDEMAGAEGIEPARLSADLHVLPYFHGNRSPRANPELKGIISGLRLSSRIEDLALLYLATVQAVAYGTRHIIESMNAHGYKIQNIFACGGGTHNPLFVQQHADITRCRLILPREQEAVLLGSAMLGAVASGQHNSLLEAMSAMSQADRTIGPNLNQSAYHDAKYAVFLKMYEDQMSYREIMK